MGFMYTIGACAGVVALVVIGALAVSGMLPNPRFHHQKRMHLAAEAVCLASSAYLFFEKKEEGLAPLAVTPLLMILIIYLENPPPGLGTGQPAEPLPGLKFLKLRCPEKQAGPPVQLGPGGALLPGHAYIFVFWRHTKSCIKTIPRVQTIANRVRAVPKVHVALICRDDFDGLDSWVGRSRGLTAPVAHDTEAKAHANYMVKWDARVVPHAFVVDRRGTILFHGQVNRRGLLDAVKTIMLEAPAKPAAAGKAELKAEDSPPSAAAAGASQQKDADAKKED